MCDIRSKDDRYVAGTYARFPITIDRGHGSEVFDTDGKRYIDMGSGIGVTALGIADDGWCAAVSAQLHKLQHMSNLYYTAPCAELAERLVNRTGMDKVFFSNSGAEANECAVKIARKYAAARGRHTILTLQNSFHGRTLTTLAATGQEHFHALFQPLTPGFVHTPAGDIAALRAAVAEHDPAAVLFECIQGEGGVLPLDREFTDELARLAAERDMLLMVDEVQTGNGRTGALYAYMHYGLTPDVVTTAKGLGGGLPIGATLMSRKVSSVLGAGDHGSTYGGNPVAAAGACYVLDRLDDDLLAAVRQKAEHAVSRLTGARGVRAVTGKGLMLGIETEKPAADVVRQCMERGVLCLTAKTKVRLLPALTIPQELLDEALDVLLAVCAE